VGGAALTANDLSSVTSIGDRRDTLERALAHVRRAALRRAEPAVHDLPMSFTLSDNSHGAAGIRVLRVLRRGDRHEVRDLEVDIALAGDFRATHVAGDNRDILPADSMKNAVYALAGRHGGGEVEEFALALTHHFLLEQDAVTAVTVTVREHRWARIAISGRPHDHAFSRGGDGRRVARVRRTRDALVVEAGIDELALLKTKHSGFQGYLRDRYTTLAETSDRVLATVLEAHWRYGWAEVPFGLHWQQVRQVILGTFAEHDSRSVQHTLYAMAQAALEQCPPIAEIRFRLAHRRHEPADLTRFGLENDNEVLVAAEGVGIIEAVVRREDI
jgi:urate oxidase